MARRRWVEQSEIDVRSFYDTHARTCEPKDFQRQVLRVLKSGPPGPEQIAMIADGITKGLDLQPDDILLDLCCGNGVITDMIFARCRGGVGVDFTPYLIEVAKTNFERSPDRLYRLGDAREYVETTDDTQRITKVMCYGAFYCLMESNAAGLLVALRRRFPNVQRVFLGNLPDLDRADICFPREMDMPVPPLQDLKRHDKPWGIWRTEQEMAKLAAECGWRTEISRMPPAFFVAEYRFDASLTAQQ
jgi:SAM-dependent methyltransferase